MMAFPSVSVSLTGSPLRQGLRMKNLAVLHAFFTSQCSVVKEEEKGQESSREFKRVQDSPESVDDLSSLFACAGQTLAAAGEWGGVEARFSTLLAPPCYSTTHDVSVSGVTEIKVQANTGRLVELAPNLASW